MEKAAWETRAHTEGLYDNDIVEFNMWLLWIHYCNLHVYKMPEIMAVLRTTSFLRMT